MRRCFDNCKLIEEYEDKTQIVNNYDFITEDNFYVKYINRSLNTYFQNYQKDYYSVRRGHNNKYSRCKRCGGIIERKNKYDYSSIYCVKCREIVNREQTKIRVRKYRNRNVTEA